MNRLASVLVALFAGVLTFLAVGVGVTTLFDPRIEFSLFVGIPVGAYAGLTALFVSYVGLAGRRDGTASSESWTALRWAAVATVLALVVVTVVGVATYFAGAGSLGLSVLLFGLPVSLGLAAVAGYLAGAVLGREPPESPSTAE